MTKVATLYCPCKIKKGDIFMQLRHERKHEISYSDLLSLRERLSAAMQRDAHAVNGRYKVRSLYLDNLRDKALLEKINGVNTREKFRYKKTFSGVMYSSSLGVTLVALTMISTLVILAVTSNMVLSLGMVGALSIVRFRTAIKEPLDIAFLFWSIAAGIVLAAGMLPLAVFGSVFIGVVLVVFANKKAHFNPYIVVLRCDSHDSEAAAMDFLGKRVRRCVVKSKTAAKGSIEINAEIRMKEDDTDFINSLCEMDGVRSAVLVSYNGDYMG